jgi:hypothetical protein
MTVRKAMSFSPEKSVWTRFAVLLMAQQSARKWLYANWRFLSFVTVALLFIGPPSPTRLEPQFQRPSQPQMRRLDEPVSYSHSNSEISLQRSGIVLLHVSYWLLLRSFQFGSVRCSWCQWRSRLY